MNSWILEEAVIARKKLNFIFFCNARRCLIISATKLGDAVDYWAQNQYCLNCREEEINKVRGIDLMRLAQLTSPSPKNFYTEHVLTKTRKKRTCEKKFTNKKQKPHFRATDYPDYLPCSNQLS